MAAEDIAARFGVTPAAVKQHLKLGAVSPKLVQAYRYEELSLDELTAFAITDDHTRQERVWSELPHYNRSRDAIRRALSDGHVSSDDRARFSSEPKPIRRRVVRWPATCSTRKAAGSSPTRPRIHQRPLTDGYRRMPTRRPAAAAIRTLRLAIREPKSELEEA
jgi:hypothetical protein